MPSENFTFMSEIHVHVHVPYGNIKLHSKILSGECMSHFKGLDKQNIVW